MKTIALKITKDGVILGYVSKLDNNYDKYPNYVVFKIDKSFSCNSIRCGYTNIKDLKLGERV